MVLIIPSVKAQTGISVPTDRLIPRAIRGSAKDHLARYNASYDVIQQAIISYAWYQMKQSGVLDKCDVFAVKGKLPSNLDATLNWNSGGAAQTLNGSPALSAKGYTLDGEDDSIVTGINPSSAGWKYSLNSAHIAILIGDDGASMENGKAMVCPLGGLSGTILYPFANSARNSVAGRLNSDSTVSANLVGSRRGVLLMNRISDESISFYFNGALLGTLASPSTTTANSQIAIGRTSSEWNPGTIAGWSIGGGLSAAQIGAHTAAMLAMLDAFSS